jgi:hypothetical protein
LYCAALRDAPTQKPVGHFAEGGVGIVQKCPTVNTVISAR